MMRGSDTNFTASVATLYERHLVPLLFTPYAIDLAERLRAPDGGAILEIAAGTGAVTRIIAERQPETASIIATDINEGMLAVASEKVRKANVTFQHSDAMHLPFGDVTFDAVVCQFGVMFFPDKIAAYREVRRVLKAGGSFLFNSWDEIAKNGVCVDAAQIAHQVLQTDEPTFLERGPFGYSDPERIVQDLRRAGFVDVAFQTVSKSGRSQSGRDAATGLFQGSPVRVEIEARGEGVMNDCIELMAAAIEKRYGKGPFETPLSAHVFTAKKEA
ncbi:MAG: methyltransferase domain-containing protein [Candidatus Eremiobacteraeota bacterium]|nr:methyltransferase domain-containing protein [Candidatus Eremiobacteraeota bacterium]